MRIIFYGYRDWSFKIFNDIKSEEKYLITHSDYDIIDKINPDIVFFVGWSHIIPKKIVEGYTCVCLHPSPLPKYRGGSPIQHQIINGESISAVSLFIMDDGLDTGDILYQSEFDITGNLSDVFNRIIQLGIKGINYIIDNIDNIDKIRVKQNNDESSSFKRRVPGDSEIYLDDFLNNDPLYLYNKIRSLNDPYPNAFVKCKNGKKLFITESRYEE